MLEATRHRSVEELFKQIPERLRLSGQLNLPGPLSEPEILEFFRQAASQSSREYASLLGAGAYTHYRPVTVDALLSRGEFFTAYTPYQAELAQGTLQAMFEFQTLITQLTGMEVANASLYDGSTATTEATLMAQVVLVLPGQAIHRRGCLLFGRCRGNTSMDQMVHKPFQRVDRTGTAAFGITVEHGGANRLDVLRG